jgi:anti-sigma factor RsiW
LSVLNREVAMNYLLNRLSEEDRISLETAFFSDNAQFEQLEIAEDELIDHYVRNELSDSDREQFDAALLTSPRLRERVNIARALAVKTAAYNSIQTEPSVSQENTPQPQSWWKGLLYPSLTWRGNLALAAILIVIFGGIGFRIGWLKSRDESQLLTAQNRELEARVADLESRNQSLASQLQVDHGQSEAPQKPREEIPPQKETNDNGRQPQPVLANLVLLPGGTRGPGSVSEVALQPKTSAVRLTLNLADADYDSYRIVVRTAEMKDISSKTGVKPKNQKNGPVLMLDLPARLLPPGDYVVQLYGLTSSGSTEPSADYSFRILRKP